MVVGDLHKMCSCPSCDYKDSRFLFKFQSCLFQIWRFHLLFCPNKAAKIWGSCVRPSKEMWPFRQNVLTKMSQKEENSLIVWDEPSWTTLLNQCSSRRHWITSKLKKTKQNRDLSGLSWHNMCQTGTYCKTDLSNESGGPPHLPPLLDCTNRARAPLIDSHPSQTYMQRM